MEYRLQAVRLGIKINRLKAVLHASIPCVNALKFKLWTLNF